MTFEIADRIRDSLGLSGDSDVSFQDVDRPTDVTVERVRDDLEDAAANGDLAVEQTGFDDESDLLGSLEPIVRDYREHHDAINSLNQLQTGWESDTNDTDSELIDEQVDDGAVAVIGRHAPPIASVLEGFGETEPFDWTTSYVNQYPYFGCLVEYVFAYVELEDQGYIE
jgi:hypothetical protein